MITPTTTTPDESGAAASSAWVSIASKRPNVGQLIAVLQASRHYENPIFLAGRVWRDEGGMYDYVNSGGGLPVMVNISAYWTPIHEPNVSDQATARKRL